MKWTRKASDVETFRSVINRLETPLVRYATRLTGNVETARDIVQDSFLKLIETRHPPLDGRLDAWLFTVCRNRAMDILRKEKRMNPMSDDAPHPSANSPDPGQSAEAAELSRQVVCALSALPTNQQEVLRLKFQNEFSYRQIAEITGLSVSNVGFLIHTGMQSLRAKFRSAGLIGK